MKKSLLLIATAAVLFSCKKKENNDFSATDMTGSTVVEGNSDETNWRKRNSFSRSGCYCKN